MTKSKLFTKILSCLLVLTILLSSFVTLSINKEAEAAMPTYTLKTMWYSGTTPVKWRFTTASGYSETRTLTTRYYRGANSNNPSNFDIVAYCMDWGVNGPDSNGSFYDHVTDDISQEKVNQLLYVAMNGYPNRKTFTLNNKYNVNRYGRSATITDDGKEGTMTMQLATQIAVWLIMGKDSRGRVMTIDGWVRNNNCQNLDCDVLEIATNLYNSAKRITTDIEWLKINVDEAEAGRFDSKTQSKVYGPFTVSSDYSEGSELTFDLSKAPNGTKVLNSNYNAVSKIEIYDDFYISVPNSAKEQKFDIKILRENGTVNPLCYEEKNENRQRMFFSNISSAVTSLSIVHTQSDAKIKIVKTSEDGRKDNFDFNVYYRKTEDAQQVHLGRFTTDSTGVISLSGLSAGYYDIYEDLSVDDEKKYNPTVVDENGKTLIDYGAATVVIEPSGMMTEHVVRFHNEIFDNTKLVLEKIDMYDYEYPVGSEIRVLKVKSDGNGNYTMVKDANGNPIYWDGKTYEDSWGTYIFGGEDGDDFLSLEANYVNGVLVPEENTYLIGERTAPEGYVKNETKYVLTLTDEMVNHIIYYDFDTENDYSTALQNRPYLNTLKIEKYITGTSTPIENVQFNLYKEVYGELEYVTTLTTDANGVAIYGLNEKGTLDIENGNALRYGYKYFIKEISAPNGYEVSDELIELPAVTEDGAEIVQKVYNNISSGTIVLTKKDSKTDAVLEGVEFEIFKVKDATFDEFDEYLYTRNDITQVQDAQQGYVSYTTLDGTPLIDDLTSYLTSVGKFTTDNNGKISKGLSYGDYIIVETKALNGYELLQTVYRVGIYEKDMQYSIVCHNDELFGEVSLLKTDSITGEGIKGVKFELYKDNSSTNEEDTLINEYTTDENGSIDIDGLRFGDYYFIETFTPDAYNAPETEETKDATAFTIDSTHTSNEIVYTNDAKQTNIMIYKTDSKTNEPLKGAIFSLHIDNVYVGDAITNDEGIAVFADIKHGMCTITEKEATLGYDKDTYQGETFEVNEYKTYRVYVGNDKIQADIKVLKVDKDTEKPLEGVEFSLYAANDENNALRTLKTDKDGLLVFEDVPYGEYIIVETATIEGYKKTESKTYANVTSADELFFTISNEVIKRTVKLIKVDKDTRIPIANVEFDVYAIIDDQFIYYTTVTTDENGECTFTLPFGKYELREKKTDKRYVLSNETTEIDLTTDDIAEILEIEITNEIIKNRISIVKTNEKGEPLANAKYGVYDLTTDKLVVMGTSDENGIIDFGLLPYGSYYIKEIEAPKGYMLSSDEIKFSVTEETSQKQVFNVTDKEIPQTNIETGISMLLAVLSLLSCALFVSIVTLNIKSKRYLKQN